MRPNTRISLTLAALACAAPGAHAADLPASVAISGGWKLQTEAKVGAAGDSVSGAQYKTSGWYDAVVPGTVLTTLVQAGVYPEPLYGENNRAIPESLNKSNYWYRTTFTVPRGYAGKAVWLRFDGINYTANVWINGHSAGEIQGAFTRGVFDVTPYVKPGATSVLAVEVHPQPHPGVPHEHTQATGTGGNGGITALDGPTFLCTIGWDWMPGIRDRDTGIWRDVTLSATGPVTLTDTDVVSDLPTPKLDVADLTVQTTLHNTTGQAQSGELIGAFGGVTFHKPITLAAAETKLLTLTSADTPQLRVQNPKLWWPNGYGPQNLYHLQLKFVAKNDTSDVTNTNFGVRKITYEVPSSENLTLSVNNVPIMVRGGDWGMDDAMKRVTAKRIDAQVRMHKLANLNMIRNWVGQSTSQYLYDACDKYGIMLWDEFFQPNPSDGPNPSDEALYLANVREKILRFRSHPSIAVWCGRNEGPPPPGINAGIQALMTELDPKRHYQPSSTDGRGVHSGGPYCYQEPRKLYSFNEPFKTEIGGVSVPTLEGVRLMMPEKDWTEINDDWAEHDLCAGAQGGDWYPKTLSARFGKAATFEDFVRKAQLANYEYHRAVYEGRNSKLFAPASGVILWMSHPAQPSFVWQLYSYDLEPNASLFGARKGNEMVHIQMNQSDWRLIAVNNSARPIANLTATATVLNLDGSVQYTRDFPVSAPSAATSDVGAIDWPANLSPVHFVKLTLRDSLKQLVSENFYWRADPAHEDDFSALGSLPTVPLTASAVAHDSGANRQIVVTLQNPAKVVALMTHLQLRRQRSGARVLPAFYSDNYVSLLPGETRTITIDAAKEDFAGETPQVVIDGWNATVAPKDAGASGVSFAPNNHAAETHTFVRNIHILKNINSGGAAVGIFSADGNFSDGNVYGSDAVVDTSAPNAGPAALYQTERWGNLTYNLPVAPADAKRAFTVRLHFAENKYESAGQRKFAVTINGKRVLNEFDIFAEAGGSKKALVKDFPGIVPNADGEIVIDFIKGSADEAKVCGVQIF
ncbi:beta-mannosidase [Capsulimonas corticalis]|uniref:Beta-mannosidase n=1 Tax=Capsulimonas corticalis TaxID=2219043 RepID=A0A402CUR6_9BACT|nr:malectin domain-containing carbohydrate-binding protein [Capsulimonas corticalis]BDI29057.1 beta-mannosidase [Capsulimonas corticalis]